ncbi:sulfurtransferase [Mangrovitalea sediminis]|uniref:sulfurtransferase n=1 Tax=Mangrovitalea sediminis TaxID=1982043 RepID=UPI000BE5523D|nr:sulfurtransferase [Mangrovitalea sediminis]
MKTPTLPGSLVSVDWLAQHQGHPRLVLLDATFQLPGAADTTAPRRIPGARRFDFDREICDRENPLPHMLPPAEDFERQVRELGVNQDSLIVVYDRVGTYSSPRGWWMFRAMGHDQVAVLDGGLPAWEAAGHSSEPMQPDSPGQGDFMAQLRQELVSNADQVAAALEDNGCVVLDARSADRFQGKAPEPRAGLRGGHMPNARNLPFDQVQEAGRMQALEELSRRLRSEVDAEQHLICSCGSGVTACILALAADLAGHSHFSVYDGSWSEWGLPSDRPVVSD